MGAKLANPLKECKHIESIFSLLAIYASPLPQTDNI